ncbi:MAG: alpha/beta hydrolase [Flavobacteriales bacterium]|nr:alpha/beta hydrolase [Flavobacteriales bacterium]
MNRDEDFYISEEDLTRSMKFIRFFFSKLSPIFPGVAARLFWHLFTNPRKRKMTDADKRFYLQCKVTKLVSEEFKKPYSIIETGSGSLKVLILHGWESRSSDFRKMIDKLKTVATVYSVDFPGHGVASKSRAHLPIFVDTIHSAVKQIGPVDVTLGHSLGAASLSMAVVDEKYFSYFKTLVFLGLHPIPSSYFLQYKKITRVNERVFEACLKYAEKRTEKSLLNYDCYNHLEVYRNYQVFFIHDSFDKIIHLDRVNDFAEKLGGNEVFTGDHGGHFRHYKAEEVILKVVTIIESSRDDSILTD